MSAPSIRVIAIGVLVEDDRLLAMRVMTPEGLLAGVRPLGGGIEFGETSATTLTREFHEEIGVDVIVGAGLETFESRFTYAGRPYHEIVLARPVRFRDPAAPRRDDYQIVEDNGVRFNAAWFALDALRRGAPPLFPAGLVERLDRLV